MEMFSPSPKLAGNWLLGLGSTFTFPTASSDYTGQGKWQVGPAAVVGYLSKKWILGAFVQNWQSFGGSGHSRTNQMNLQPIAAYFYPTAGVSDIPATYWQTGRPTLLGTPGPSPSGWASARS